MVPEIPPQVLAVLADAPLAVLVVWMMHLLRRDMQAREAPPPAPASDAARAELAAFKLEVARTYVPLSLIRDLDTRLSLHLVRIEEKLDEVSRAATAAAAVSGQPLPGRRMGFVPRGDGEAGQPAAGAAETTAWKA
jgi:hypothetical protein